MTQPYTEEDVELVAKAYDEVPWPCEHAGASSDPGDWWTCNTCTARAILAALSSAGRLVPPDSEVREEWGARLHRDDGFTDDELRTGPRFLAESRVAFHRRKIEEVPGWRVRAAELISRRVITTPWSVPDTEQEG